MIFCDFYLVIWFSNFVFCVNILEHKLVMVGLDNAGKTTILYQFLMNEVVHTSPTIGSNVEEVVWRNIHFLVWDLGGQQTLRAAWSTYYTNTEVSIYSFNHSLYFSWQFSWICLSSLVVHHYGHWFHRSGEIGGNSRGIVSDVTTWRSEQSQSTGVRQ